MDLDSLNRCEEAKVKITEDLKEIEALPVTATDFNSFPSEISKPTIPEAVKITIEDFLSGPSLPKWLR